MSVDTTSHGNVEEPSAAAQVEAMEETVVEAIPEDEIATFGTAEQGSAAEPSAAAQEAMLRENS